MDIAAEVLAALPSFIQAGLDVMGLINSANAILARGDPTAQDFANIKAQIEALEAQLDS